MKIYQNHEPSFRICGECGISYRVPRSRVVGENPKFCTIACKKADTAKRRSTPLTRERLMELLSYDPKTGVFRWRASPTNRANIIPAGSIAGHSHKRGYVRILIDGRSHAAHRLAWLYVYGAYPADQIDHRDGVRRNNAIANLRDASNQQNQWNVGPKRTSQTGIKGVWPKAGKYIARIQNGQRQQHLGYFETPEEAREAYTKAAAELHGAFARTS
jgi:hypothetical protein